MRSIKADQSGRLQQAGRDSNTPLWFICPPPRHPTPCTLRDLAAPPVVAHADTLGRARSCLIFGVTLCGIEELLSGHYKDPAAQETILCNYIVNPGLVCACKTPAATLIGGLKIADINKVTTGKTIISVLKEIIGTDRAVSGGFMEDDTKFSSVVSFGEIKDSIQHSTLNWVEDQSTTTNGKSGGSWSAAPWNIYQTSSFWSISGRKTSLITRKHLNDLPHWMCVLARGH